MTFENVAASAYNIELHSDKMSGNLVKSQGFVRKSHFVIKYLWLQRTDRACSLMQTIKNIRKIWTALIYYECTSSRKIPWPPYVYFTHSKKYYFKRNGETVPGILFPMIVFIYRRNSCVPYLIISKSTISCGASCSENLFLVIITLLLD